MLLKLSLLAMSVVVCHALMVESANLRSNGLRQRRNLQGNEGIAQASNLMEFQPYESSGMLQESIGQHEPILKDPMSVAAS